MKHYDVALRVQTWRGGSCFWEKYLMQIFGFGG